MSLVNSYKPAGGVAAGTYALGFTPTVGNTLIFCGHMTAASNTLTGVTLGSGRNFTTPPSLDAVTDSLFSENTYCLSRVVQAGDAASVTFTVSAGNMYFYVLEVSGIVTPETSGFEAATHVSNGSGSVHSSTFTTSNNNDFVLVLNRYSGSAGTISGVSSGYTQLTNGRANTDFFYSNDVGASGSKTFSWTSSVVGNNAHIYTFKSAVTDPNVGTVSGSSATEGGNLVFTVNLSGATNRTTGYNASFTGGTASAADYNNALSSATFSGGVTFSSGQFLVPTGISSFTATIATTQDTLDEDDETAILTVGGVSGTGTITDDDALPVITISDAVESFGVVTFNITLSPVSGKEVVVNYATTNGSKIAGTHYTATSGTLTFAPGETVKTVSVQTL